MGRHLQQPLPLQGPIDVRTLLFTRVLNRDVFRLHGQWGGVFLALLGALGVSVLIWITYDENHWFFRHDDYWAVVLFGAMIVEGISLLWALKIVWFELPHWRRKGGLAELSLTLLRPVSIAQFILSGGLLSCWVFWGATFIGSSICLVYYWPQGLIFLLPSLLVILNGIISVYTYSWVALTLNLALRPVAAFWAFLFFVLVYLTIVSIPATMVGCCCWAMSELFEASYEEYLGSLMFTVPVATVALWAIKLLFARAYAAKLEQAVFPQLDF
jgi:hypothetical protein